MPSSDETQGGAGFPDLSATQPAGPGFGSSDPRRPVHDRKTQRDGLDADPSGASHTAGAESASAPLTDPAQFARALVEVGLIDADTLEPFLAVPSADVLELARALVGAGKLTPYQSAAVYQGKSRGLLIGNYEIVDKLGVGGMGIVFKARHRQRGVVVALKMLPPSFARDRTAVTRFRREFEAAGRLRHPNLVAALEADEDRGVHFLVMEHVEGRDLAHIVRERGKLPVAQAADCVIQAAHGLEAAHAQGIIHRDIKPSNLMLDAAGTVRVLDLGLARITSAANPFGQVGESSLTGSGTYMGTADYMAPEQAEDSHAADHRSDIYSLGCTLYYLLTGHVPFQEKTILKRMMAHLERPAPSLTAARPEVPGILEAAYQKMMAKHPDDRPWSMADVIALLEPCKAAAVAPVTKKRPKLMVFNEPPRNQAAPPKSDPKRRVSAHRDEHESAVLVPELGLDDLEMEVRPESPRYEPVDSPYSFQSTPYPFRKRGISRRSRLNSRLVAAAAALLFGAWLLGLAAYRLATDTGELLFETDRDDVQVVVKQSGTPVRFIDTKAGKRVTLDSGAYELALKNQSAGLKISPATLSLKRGEKVKVTIE